VRLRRNQSPLVCDPTRAACTPVEAARSDLDEIVRERGTPLRAADAPVEKFDSLGNAPADISAVLVFSSMCSSNANCLLKNILKVVEVVSRFVGNIYERQGLRQLHGANGPVSSRLESSVQRADELLGVDHRKLAFV